MKKMKFYLSFILILCFMIVTTLPVQADMGPKPSTTVSVEGMEDISYTITLIAKHATGPYIGEGYDETNPDYHPIMDYVDDDGFKYVGLHWQEEGNATIEWGYHPPYPFKILIMTDDGDIYVSRELDRYAFHSYYKADLSSQDQADEHDVTIITQVEKDYNFTKESLSFIGRVLATIVIEVLIAFGFLLASKRNLKIFLLMNVITQIVLNLILNITAYYSGVFSALFLYLMAEGIVFLVELFVYLYVIKDKKKLIIITYTLVANLLSFLTGLILYMSYYQSVHP